MVYTKRAEQKQSMGRTIKRDRPPTPAPPFPLSLPRTEYLQASGVEAEITDEIDKDVKRLLSLPTDFSKIGSQPEIQL